VTAGRTITLLALATLAVLIGVAYALAFLDDPIGTEAQS